MESGANQGRCFPMIGAPAAGQDPRLGGEQTWLAWLGNEEGSGKSSGANPEASECSRTRQERDIRPSIHRAE